MMDDDRGLTQNTAQMNDILHWLTCYFYALVQIGATLSISYLSWTHLHSLELRIVSRPFSAYFCGELWRPLDVEYQLSFLRSLSGDMTTFGMRWIGRLKRLQCLWSAGAPQNAALEKTLQQEEHLCKSQYVAYVCKRKTADERDFE